MNIFQFEYKNNFDSRLDQFLTSVCKEFSRAFIQKLIKDSCVSVNGKIISKTGFKLSNEDKIELKVPELKEMTIEPVNLDLDIIEENKNYLIVNKPSGLLVHPGAGTANEATLVNGILHHVTDLSGIGGMLRPGIVHRLDRDTSGLILVCKTDKAHKYFAEKFKNREMIKKYLLLTFAVPKEGEGIFRTEIGRHPLNRVKMSSNGLNAKEAITSYKVLESYEYFSYIEATLHTGRTHQIRVHMSENNLPLLGDEVYQNKNISNNIWQEIAQKIPSLLKVKKKITRLMLHSSRLSFIDIDGSEKKFIATLPKEFENVLQVLRKNY